MLVWTEFCQEMFACFEECELEMLALSRSCQRDCFQGKVQKPCGEGRCCTERVAQLQSLTLLECHGGDEGKRCLLPLIWLFKLREGPKFNLLSELEQPCSWLAVRGASR